MRKAWMYKDSLCGRQHSELIRTGDIPLSGNASSVNDSLLFAAKILA